jgi:hypothetical protein
MSEQIENWHGKATQSSIEAAARKSIRPHDFDTWLAQGIAQGWCGPAVCASHDGTPTTADEDEEWETGDPCLHILRLYPDQATKEAVESNHSPSVWRKR